MRTVTPDTQHGHREADAGHGSPDYLIPDEEIDLAADLLTVDLLVQEVIATCAGAALFNVRVVEHLVAGDHASRRGLFLASLREGSSLLGGSGVRGWLAEKGWGDVIG